MAKRIYRSRKSSVIAGVCGGIAEYFDVDPVLVRIINVILVFWHGLGLLFYIIGWIAIPKAPAVEVVEADEVKKEPTSLGKYLPGIILILVGSLFLIDRLFWWFHWRYVWPSLLILGGIALIIRSTYEKHNKGEVHESY